MVIPKKNINTNIENNREIFIYKIIDELVRNKYKRLEILENNINQIRKNKNYEDNYYQLTDLDINEGKIRDIYISGKRKYTKDYGIFDTDTEKLKRKLELIKTQYLPYNILK